MVWKNFRAAVDSLARVLRAMLNSNWLGQRVRS